MKTTLSDDPKKLGNARFVGGPKDGWVQGHLYLKDTYRDGNDSYILGKTDEGEYVYIYKEKAQPQE